MDLVALGASAGKCGAWLPSLSLEHEPLDLLGYCAALSILPPCRGSAVIPLWNSLSDTQRPPDGMSTVVTCG
jgi:hypothetical protein